MEDRKRLDNPMSPDFKRVTGRLRVVKRRRPTAVLTDTKLATLESTAGHLPRQKAESRNPFKAPRDDVPRQDTVTGCDVVPGTPDKHCALDVIDIVPRTPDDDEKTTLLRKRRRLTAEVNSAPVLEQSHHISLLFDSPTQQRKHEERDSYKHVEELGRDLSIISHIRIVSEGTLSHLFNTTPSQNSDALHNFTTESDALKSREACVQFHKSLHFYQYPDLPWLRLCPRVVDTRQQSSSIPEGYCSHLHTKWLDSFPSAYSSLCSGYSSSFYLLCDGFSVLFSRCPNCLKLSAVVSPTTRGFRQSIKDRGIDYTLPLYSGAGDVGADMENKAPEVNVTGDRTTSNTNATFAGTERADTDAENDTSNLSQMVTYTKCFSTDSALTNADRSLIETDSALTDADRSLTDRTLTDADSSMNEATDTDDPLEWLEGIGLERSNFPSLRSAKVQQEVESFKKIDYRPASTVLIQSREMCDKLVLFLTTYPKCASTTGQLANIPPTIVSRSPFLHATIQKIKCHSGVRRDSTGEEVNYIDLSGFILPETLHDISTDILTKLQPHSIHTTITRAPSSDVYNTALSCQSCFYKADNSLPSQIHCYNGKLKIK